MFKAEEFPLPRFHWKDMVVVSIPFCPEELRLEKEIVMGPQLSRLERLKSARGLGYRVNFLERVSLQPLSSIMVKLTVY